MFDMIGGIGVGAEGIEGLLGRMGFEGRYSLKAWNSYNVKDTT